MLHLFPPSFMNNSVLENTPPIFCCFLCLRLYIHNSKVISFQLTESISMALFCRSHLKFLYCVCLDKLARSKKEEGKSKKETWKWTKAASCCACSQVDPTLKQETVDCRPILRDSTGSHHTFPMDGWHKQEGKMIVPYFYLPNIKGREGERFERMK